MNKFTKVLLGLITILPIFYFIFFMWFIISGVMGVQAGVAGTAGGSIGLFDNFQMLFIMHGIVMVLMLSLMLFYVVHLIKTKNIEQDQKTIWILVLLLAGFVGMPIYWYFNIWKDNSIKNDIVGQVSQA